MWHSTVVPSCVVSRIAAPSAASRTDGDQSLTRAETNATASTRACMSVTVVVWLFVRRTSTSDEPQGALLQLAVSAPCVASVDAEPTAVITTQPAPEEASPPSTRVRRALETDRRDDVVGVIGAARDLGLHLPVVVRIEGTNAPQGRKLLAESGLDLIVATDLTDAARKVVAAAARK